ncbi:glycosyltransferase [Tenacibaculum sp. 190524A02b]|uniref:Glycosyl transferase family 2 n=1 Tax=Tenacibaculum vairaonense TaxID=3137860 RepID=A0ABP1FDN6_9FLAO
MKVGIIIPCYNEEKRLNLQAFRKCLRDYTEFHLCFVNDGSKDNTLEVLNNFKEEFRNRITVINMKKNQGKSAAIRVGARFFYSQTKIEYVGYLDADLSTDFEDFDGLLKSLKQNRKLIMVFGSRNCGNQDVNRSAMRKMFSSIVMFCIQMILGLPIKDTQCGAKVFRKKYIPVMYNSIFKSRWLFDVEMFLRLKKHFNGKNIMEYIKEQPLKKWNHVEDSKLGLKDSLQIPFRLAKIWVAYSLS